MSGIFKKFRMDDIQITPFEAHKDYLVNVSNYTGSYFEKGYEQIKVYDHWVTASAKGIDIRPISLSVFAYDSEFDGSDFMPNEFGKYLQVTKSSPHAVTTNGFYKRALHDSLQGMYYTNPNDPCWTLDNNGYEKEIRTLAKSAFILSVPQRMFGERIKKGSVKIQSGSVTLIDDGFGNLIDTSNYITAASESISYVSKSVFALNFTDLYNRHDQKISAHSINALASSSFYRDSGREYYDLRGGTRFFEKSKRANIVEAHNIRPTTSSTSDNDCQILFDGLTPETSESRRNFETQSLLNIKHDHHFDVRRDEDYSIYLRVSASQDQPSSGSTDPHIYLYSKQDVLTRGNYPFSIRLCNENADGSATQGNAGCIQAAISDGVTTLHLNGTTVITGSTGYDQIILTVSASTSTAFLYVNGSLDATGNIPNGDIHNEADILFGAKVEDTRQYEVAGLGDGQYARRRKPIKEYKQHFKGGVDQIMQFNQNLTIQEVNFVTSHPTFENKVGNVFYNHGIMTLTNGSASYQNATQGGMFSECTLSFQNTHTIIEHEYNCHIKENEYGFTMNPTIMENSKTRAVKTFVSRSEWTPYVTTIGLYDENARLLAVGKMSRPIKKSHDYDTTFVVSFDT